jgi:hypothetical protein
VQAEEDRDEPLDEKMKRLTANAKSNVQKVPPLENAIRKNMKALGYGG